MWLTPEITKYLQLGGLALVMVVSIAFSFGKHEFRKSSGVQVLIDNSYENYFVEQAEVMELMNGGERDYITGAFLSDIDLRKLERNIEAHSYVGDAQVYTNLRGVITVEVKQKKPIARLRRTAGDDLYITETGELVPVSGSYTARVPLIELDNEQLIGSKVITETEYGEGLFTLLTRVNGDQFWSAQMAGFLIDDLGEIRIQPQVTKQIIEFGMPRDIEGKLKKLEIFYKEILPAQGWNYYDRVSVKYDNQIICE